MSGGAGVLIGAVVVIIILIVVIVLSLPYIKGQISAMTHQGTPTINPTINVQLPTSQIPSGSTTTK
jgi:competence protein ComGC